MSKNSNFNVTDLNDTKNMNSLTLKKIAQDHTININNLDEKK